MRRNYKMHKMEDDGSDVGLIVLQSKELFMPFGGRSTLDKPASV